MIDAAMRLVMKVFVSAMALGAFGVLPRLRYEMAHKAYEADKIGIMSLGKFNRMLINGGKHHVSHH